MSFFLLLNDFDWCIYFNLQGNSEKLPLRAWLVPINPTLEQYVDALVAYGYEDTTILQEAETEDLQESFEECKVKKPHRRLILKAFEGLKKSSQV